MEAKEKKETEENKNVSEELVKLEEKKNELQVILTSIDEKYKDLEVLQKSIDEKMQTFNEKEETLNSKLEAISEKDIKEVAMSTKEQLDKEKKITISIPKSELNPLDVTVPVAINGYAYIIKRGEEVEVPMSIYKILKESKYI